MLQRRVEKALDLREGHDFVELPVDFALAHAQDRAAQIDILAAGQLGMKAGADFEQAADASANLREAGRRARDARKHLQQRRLAGAVAADQADDFALRDVKADVAQRPQKIAAQRLRLRLSGDVNARVSTSRKRDDSARARRRGSACRVLRRE